MSKYVCTNVNLPRDLRARLDDYNREHHLGDHLSAEIVRRLEMSFDLDAHVERVLHAIDYSARPADVMDTVPYATGIGQGAPEAHATKYIVVGRLPAGQRTFLDTPEDAVAHAQKLIGGLSDNGKNRDDPLLVAEIITVVERAAPLPPPVQVRPPRVSDFPVAKK